MGDAAEEAGQDQAVARLPMHALDLPLQNPHLLAQGE